MSNYFKVAFGITFTLALWYIWFKFFTRNLSSQSENLLCAGLCIFILTYFSELALSQWGFDSLLKSVVTFVSYISKKVENIPFSSKGMK